MTIDDIASALGVSKTTVSRAISGKGRISPDTREKVNAYIREHNFKPNVVAKGLAQNRTFNIGVVWPGDYGIADLPFFQRCMIGICNEAAEHGYDILVSLLTGDDITSIRRIVENRKVDGMILTRTLVKDYPAEYLLETDVPFVSVGTSTLEGVTSVDNDNFGACRELTSILIGKGLRRLALIGGPRDHVITVTRQNGFLQAFTDCGLQADPNLIYMNIKERRQLGAVMASILEHKVDGVICMDDWVAEEVIARCRTMHVSIPSDLRVASFYNSSILENLSPSITSISFDDRMLGVEAAKSLFERIDGRDPGNRVIGSYNIILKESTKI